MTVFPFSGYHDLLVGCLGVAYRFEAGFEQDHDADRGFPDEKKRQLRPQT
jgi:hypothetical protein